MRIASTFRLCSLLAIFALVLPAIRAAAPPRRGTGSDPGFLPPDTRWVQRTLKRMSLRDQIAQLIQVRIFGRYYPKESAEFQSLVREIQENHVGGLILFAGNIYESAHLINRLQETSALPLIVAADFESGASFRIADTTSFPWTMAVGAAGSEDLAFRQGAVTARESRAMGVHWIYAPVMDVNNNPDNPVISIRSFGEYPQQVARLGSAFIRGARSQGVMTTAKHFPGHGDTATDTHIGLARIPATRERLESLELIPFRAAIRAGVDSIMTAHLAVPNLTGEADIPATLSPRILTDLLRNELQFPGLLVTDAMEMGGITTRYWGGLAAVKAIQAGADVLILPPDNTVAIDEILRAVRDGRIPEARIRQSAEKLLLAKTRLGLHKRRTVDPTRIPDLIAAPESRKLAQELADRSLTLVRNEKGLLPFHPVRPPSRMVHLLLAGEQEAAPLPSYLAELKKRFPEMRTLIATPRLAPDQVSEILQQADWADAVLCSSLVRVISGKGTVALPGALHRLMEQLFLKGKPVAWVSFGNPYLLRVFPQGPSAYVCTFSYSDVSQVAAAKAISGEIPFLGKMPVSIPGCTAVGAGLETQPVFTGLNFPPPDAAAVPPAAFQPIRELLASYVERRAFPGAALLVGYRGSVVLDAAAGRLDYSPQSAAVDRNTVYDLASVSKAAGTTSAAMKLAEEGRLQLEAAVQDYLPEFKGQDKEKVKVRHLLEHRAGLPPFLLFYKEAKGYEPILRRICETPLEAPPGSRTKYSDLGMILMGEILSRVSARPLNRYLAEEIFQPLGMTSTTYLPPKSWLARIAPTEQDPWRGRVVRGEVHDENAFAMGGVAGHAGLFGSARDLAVFAQMMMNRGLYDHRRTFQPATVSLFTRAQEPPERARGLGWGKAVPGYWTERVFSPSAFGHTGFTGTMIWVDPGQELFIVLLTNRVHPTRSNNLVEEAREKICEAVVKAVRESARP